MQIALTIDDSRVWAITAAMQTANAEMPQTVDGPADANGNTTQVPNPALYASETQYLLARLNDVLSSYERQHAQTAPPPAPAPAPPINGVPQSVDMVKACVYFVSIGVMDAINAAVSQAGPAAQVIWQRSKTVQRQNPLMLQIAHQVLHWSDADIDRHFIAADKVVV